MRQTRNILLKYREKGFQEIEVPISFISSQSRMDYADIQKTVNKVSALWNEQMFLFADTKALQAGNEDDKKEKIKDNYAKINKLTEELKAYSDSDFFEKRFQLILDILEDNDADEKLLEKKFWMRRVDSDALVSFLNDCMAVNEPESKKKALIK